MDFDSLVLVPAMAVFGEPVVVTPTASQPGAPAYLARGVLKIENIDVQLMDGIMSSKVTSLGVRLKDFAIFLAPGDNITVRTVNYVVDDTDEDGQGGSIVTLKSPDGSS